MFENNELAKKGLVSVVMPAYNAERFITEAIESILSQTYKNIEFIIVDDGSVDKTRSIIEDFSRKDSRVVLLKHVNNEGIIRTLNEGLKVARGEYIARMDADDISLPERFQKQIAYLESNPQVFMVGTDALNIDDSGKYLREIKIANGGSVVVDNIKRMITPLHPSLMFRNTGEVFYREKALVCEDLDMYLRLIYDGKIIDSISEPLIKYRTLSSGLSASKFMKQKLFSAKMLELYNQRVATGVDGYDDFDVNELLSVENSPENIKATDQFNVLLLFNTNKFTEFRVKATEYMKKYGYVNRMTIFYLCSFLPVRIIDLLRQIR